jgi:hypothetical protein
MAKHCDVCNQDYADDLPVCPHCAAAKTTQLASPREARATQRADVPLAGPADSAIDFGQSPTSKPATGDASGADPASLSSASGIAWSALVEEPSAEELKVDAPSDADLLARAAAESAAAPPGPPEERVGELSTGEPPAPTAAVRQEGSGIDLSASLPEAAMGPGSDSALDLGASPVEWPQDGPGVDPARAAAESEAAPPVPPEERVGELGTGEPSAPTAAFRQEASGVDLSATPPEAAMGPGSDSALDLGAAPAEWPQDGSGVDVKATPPEESEVFVAELASDASRVDLVGESGVHLAGVEPAAEVVEAVVDPSAVEAELVEEAALDAAGPSDDSSAVDLGASPVPSEEEVVEPVSGVEVEEVVEAVGDSGISVQGFAPAGADSNPPSGSSVDIGSRAGVVPEEASGEPVAGTSDLALESLLAEESSKERLAKEEAVSASEEPAVSEKEVDDLLAGLEQTPAEGDLAARAEGETAAEVAEGEEAIAEAEAEEAAAKEEEKPAKPVGQRSRILYLVGATGLGILLGAGGDRALVGLGEKPKAQIQPPAQQTQQPRGPSREDLANMVRNGDYEAATKAGIDQAQAATDDELAARGEYRLGAYLQKARGKIDPDDPGLQPAIADLTKAAEKNADALYHLGLISELGNNLPKAREAYTKGVQAFPAQKRRFQSALDRVEWKEEEKARGAARAPRQEREHAALLALLLISLQQPAAQAPQPGQPQPPAEPKADEEEAGSEFWNANKLARQRNFAEAIPALDKARKRHEERRFSRLRKAQNPLSDPTEDIFLRCCDELKAYWQMQDHLRDGRYLTDKNTPSDALNSLLQTAQTNRETVKGISDKLVKGKIIAEGDDVSKGIDRAIAAKENADKEIADLKTEQEKKLKEADEKAAKLEKTIKDRDAKLADTEKLKADNTRLQATLQKITAELAAAKLVDPKEKVDVGAAVKKVIDVAKMKDPGGEIRKQRDDLARAMASLQARWRPEEMLPLWRLLLEQNRGRTELANKAVLDVNRVKADGGATMAQKGEAQIVRGLALRNNERFDEAKAALQAGRSVVDRGEWLMTANTALKEVSDPAAYYSIQARELSDRGRLDAALTMLDHALRVLPAAQHAKLLAQRSMIELDAARSKARGPLSPSDSLVAAASRDADAAAKTGLAEGHYAAGRVAEELGRWDAAIQSYRKAKDAHPALDAEGSRYRVALARVLLQPREVRPGPPASPPAPPTSNKVGWRDPAPYPARHRQDLKEFVLMVVLGLQAPLLPGDQPGLEEAERLADEILRAPPGTVPFNVHAQALAIKGLWSEALREYVAGILPLLPPEYRDGLMYLILNDPRLKRPDSLRIPNPMEAEKHFAAGLNFYFDCDFANAEQEFLLTIRNESQDARYFYFLGLARLGRNNRRDALADFAAGAELERANRPAPPVVSESLERIQGPMRTIVNEYRYRPERLEPVPPARRP